MTDLALDSRARILAAATAAFASRGFDATSVDDIARESGLNKAMIYYHFENKNGLYVEILRDMIGTLGARTRAIADATGAPADKLSAFIDAFSAEADARPAFPFLMVREMADGARRLDPDTLRLMTIIVGNLGAILAEGVKAGVFRRTNPFLTYFTLISPIIFFRVSAPVRAALSRERLAPDAVLDRDAFVAQVKAGALAVLDAGAPKKPGGAPHATAPRRRRTPRTGARS